MLVNNIAQFSVYDYFHNEELLDLNRVALITKQIPYDELIAKLDMNRGNGRNDYPNTVMLNITFCQFITQNLDVARMRRALGINPTLRELVGISDKESRDCGRAIVPSPAVFSRFLNRLVDNSLLLDRMFEQLRERVYMEISGVGIRVAGDGKYFDSFTPNMHHGEVSPTRRAEHDATYSIKQYVYPGTDGMPHSKKETHFGFRKHTLVDSITELPLASILVPANMDEKACMTHVFTTLPGYMIERMKYASFDRGYDSADFLKMIRAHDIKPIIDKRRMRPGDLLNKYKEFEDTILYYTDSGEVFFLDFTETNNLVNPDTGYPMCIKRAKYVGYRRDKHALAYLCNGKYHLVYIDANPRVFNEVPRDTLKFEREYNLRTSVERYHSRLDVGFGFETHTIRGLAKMRVMVKLADIVMLASALAHREKNQTNYASLFDYGFI